MVDGSTLIGLKFKDQSEMNQRIFGINAVAWSNYEFRGSSPVVH